LPVDVPSELVEACQRGDAAAFEELVKLTHRDVYTLALRIVGNPEDAADVSQETYIKLMRAIGSFRGDAKFSTWLYRVTSSVAISHLRKQARRRADLSLDAEGVGELQALTDTGAEAERHELKVHLEEALQTLPFGYRAVVVMKDIYGFSLDEVGRQLGITEGAAKVRLFRARQRLKERLFDQVPSRNPGKSTRKKDDSGPS
jgi:RNA polymerase sigma-70 factor (ECF subfamily)